MRDFKVGINLWSQSASWDEMLDAARRVEDLGFESLWTPAGGVPDAQVIGDTEGAVAWMRAQAFHNGKVAVLGTCSGGRHAFIYACQRKDVDACAELWGGRVVMSKEELTAKQPTAPIEFAKNLSCPLLGLFGNEDRAPSPEQVNQHEAELK